MYKNQILLGLLLLLSTLSLQAQFDVALRIFPASNEVVEPGDKVPFVIEVHNQGIESIKRVTVVDYVPAGLIFNVLDNPGWTILGNVASYQIEQEIPSGTFADIQIVLEVKSYAKPNILANYAEVSQMFNLSDVDVSILDVDSQLDSNPDNDKGAAPFTETDDQLDGTGIIDEDDHDVALVLMCTETTCNNQVNLSLNAACHVQLEADMFMEDPAYPNGAYEIIAYDENNQVIPNNIVNGYYLGQNIKVEIFLPGCEGWGCTAHALIEDKFAIDLFCSIDTTDCKNIDPDYIGVPLAPTAWYTRIGDTYIVDGMNGCSDVILTFEDHIEELDCQSGIPFLQKITRTWHAVDGEGNVNTCASIIYVRKGNISDMIVPKDSHLDPLDCATVVLLPDGNPDPVSSGYPEGVDCPNIIVVFEDLRLDGKCIGTFDVFRTWTVVDWCNAEDTTFTQRIKVMDSLAPVCNLPAVIKSGTHPDLCGGRVELPHPSISDNCSETSYSVKYKLKTNAIYDPVGLKNIGISGSAQAGYVIDYLPVGEYWVEYTTFDLCGNVSRCHTTLIVEDTTVPTPICMTQMQVILDDNGVATIHAMDLDNGSYDHCSPVHFKVRRMNPGCTNQDSLFQDQATLCCNDVGQETMVIFRVYDAAGNFNDCMVLVDVFDQSKPIIHCPADVTINCTEYAMDPLLLNLPKATATDNCSVDIEYFDVKAFNDCGVGILVRTWKALDPAGLEAECKQYIEVVSDYNYNINDIKWPANATAVGCTGNDADPAITGEPLLPGETCSNFEVSYEDFKAGKGTTFCNRIRRVWEVKDLCAFGGNQNVFVHDQYIELDDQVAPVFLDCTDRIILADVDSCSAYVDMSVSATDDCSAQDELVYTMEVDLNGNGVIDQTIQGKRLKGIYPNGQHIVHVSVSDACFNVQTCSFNLNVKDSKAPTPVCLPISVSLGADGSVEVWASDLDHYSYDNCQSSNLLTFSFSEDINDTNITFTCDDIDNGVVQTFEVTMYVWDTNGNKDYCTTYIKVSDALDVCTNSGSVMASVGGNVMTTKDEQSIMQAMIYLQDSENNMQQTMTDQSGNYMFDQVEYFKDYSLKVEKNDDYLNGVTTFDIVQIQKHILGIQSFTTPQQYIAADVNNSSSVTGSDIIQLRKLILGLYQGDVLPENDSWRFYPSNYSFNPAAPYDLPESFDIQKIDTTIDSLMFYGIKIGDINQSAKSNFSSNTSTVRTIQSLEFNDQQLTKDALVEVPVRLSNLNQLEGIQFALDFDETKVEVVGITSGSIEVAEDNYRITDKSLFFSWNTLNAKEVDKSAIFSLWIRAKEDVILSETSWNINNKSMTSEVFEPNSLPDHLKITWNNLVPKKVSIDNTNFLEQNIPNPFSETTDVPFNVQEAGKVFFTIYSIDGTIIRQEDRYVLPGEHIYKVQGEWFTENGMYYVQLDTKSRSQAIKIMKIF